MILVTSMMTNKELSNDDTQKALDILSKRLNCNAVSSKYHYDDQQYYETDIDLHDVEFTKETLHNGIHLLIAAYEEILNTTSIQIDFIAANDDTATEVSRYERDINDIDTFGLFVTKRNIMGQKPYYSSNTCNAYLNLTHVSFGVYD